MSADSPRVLVTGCGGPSGISILRAMVGEPVTMLAGDIDPFAAGLYLVDPTRRSILPRGDDPRFADQLLERCRRETVNVVIPTVDTELLPLARRRAEFAEAGTTLVLASE
jgi:carbamoyl-phosphate synthase large subunit